MRRLNESSRDLELLRKIKSDDDGIAILGYSSGPYTTFYCLVPYANKSDIGTDYRGDIAGCLEYTLHELIDSGHEEDVYSVMGAFERDYDDEYQNEMDEYGELIDIDLGYCIGPMDWFEVIEAGNSINESKRHRIKVSEDSYGGSTALINQSLETINKLKSQFFGYCASKADLNAVEDYLYKVADIMETAVDRCGNKSAHKASLYSKKYMR